MTRSSKRHCLVGTRHRTASGRIRSSLTFKAAGVALFSWLLLSLVTWSAPQGLHFYDPVVQLKAYQQHSRGESPTWNIWMRVDPMDLSRDIPEPIGWWPPAIPILADAATRSLGLDLGTSLRLIVVAAGAVGVAGWAVWWSRFSLPAAWLFGFVALIPWLRHASSMFFRFSGEIFAFAAAPWIFLGLAGCLARLRRNDTSLAVPALTGLAIGFGYWLKYSLFVTALAGLFATVILASRGLREWRSVLRPLLALSLAMAVAPIALKLLLATQGALDPVGRANPANLTATLALFFVGNPALGLADAAGLFFDLLVHPGFAGLGGHHHSIVAWIGFPGGILLLWLLRSLLPRRDEIASHVALGTLTLPIFAVLMLGLWVSSDVARDTRFFIPVAFAALPAVLLAGRSAWITARAPLRALLLTATTIYLVAPLVYGPLFVALKIVRSHESRPGPTGLALPSLGTTDTRTLAATLRTLSAPNQVWILENLEGSLEISARCLTPISGRSVAQDMRNIYQPPSNLAHWATSRPIELRAHSPNQSGPPALLATLRNIESWQRLPAGVPDVVIWSTTMRPSVPEPSRP